MKTIESNIDLMLAMRGSYGNDVDEVIIRVAVHIESAKHHLAEDAPRAARYHRDNAAAVTRGLNSEFDRDGVPAVSDLAWNAIYKLETEYADDLLRTCADVGCVQCGATVKGVPHGMSELCWPCAQIDEHLEADMRGD